VQHEEIGGKQMKELVPKDKYGVFADIHDTARVDSLFVAQFFEKEHKNVLADIRKILSPNSGLSEDFGRLNFQPTSYTDVWNRKQTAYAMTRDGFTMLVMGYTGQKAMRFKELYIRRFNEMEQFIKTLAAARKDFPLLAENIRLLHENPKPYHFSNECDMINRIVTGMSAKQFRQARGLEKGASIRHI
jgi:Rha family phage regulatory protein